MNVLDAVPDSYLIAARPDEALRTVSKKITTLSEETSLETEYVPSLAIMFHIRVRELSIHA